MISTGNTREADNWKLDEVTLSNAVNKLPDVRNDTCPMRRQGRPQRSSEASVIYVFPPNGGENK